MKDFRQELERWEAQHPSKALLIGMGLASVLIGCGLYVALYLMGALD